ncbi:hypothetical protein J4225_03965 [Candidatus Pacearchaeota archaeon]|nr:hypothetical protein [Candidatus Pacearchaeota archaeon]
MKSKSAVNSIFKEVLIKVNPSNDFKEITPILNKFLEKLKRGIKKQKIKAEVFVGGSFAKRTIIKREIYDVDIFIRFDKKYNQDTISALTEKILKTSREKYTLIHGSRDYFKVTPANNFCIELIPVMKISKPNQAQNITDLSYSHVKYVKNKLKTKKLVDEVMLVKAFCYANKCYGAESYIRGFSGYSLELLILHYKSFINFIKAVAKSNGKDKIVIDLQKHYKNKSNILMDINSSKLLSPIILVDPTFKQRNALAALSEQTFEKFKETCKKFINNPKVEAFELKGANINEIKENAKKNKREFIQLEITTDKQEGDIAGSKLFKFYNFLVQEISIYFDVKSKGFDYYNKKSAQVYFTAKAKKEIITQGPHTTDKNNARAFKKAHKNYLIKNSRLYAKNKVDFSINNSINNWKKKNARRINEMSIRELRIVG